MIRLSHLALLVASLSLTGVHVHASELKIDLSGLESFSSKRSDQKSVPARPLQASFDADKKQKSSTQYQQTETVSSVRYSSQVTDAGMRRNIELVKPKNDSFTLSPVKVSPVNTSGLTASAVNFDVKAEAASDEMIDEPEESMLSFIDDWLGIEPVRPWQKGTLAKKEMKPGGVVPEFDLFSEKVFSYKQGSVGGSGVGGGGCGCN